MGRLIDGFRTFEERLEREEETDRHEYRVYQGLRLKLIERREMIIFG